MPCALEFPYRDDEEQYRFLRQRRAPDREPFDDEPPAAQLSPQPSALRAALAARTQRGGFDPTLTGPQIQ